jgi:hypothetical protein
MHIATMAIWFGWALFYGSVDNLVAASLILLMVLIFVPTEERGISKVGRGISAVQGARPAVALAISQTLGKF